jgi:hypothetical protein
MGRLVPGEAAANMFDASLDTIVKEQDESLVEDMRKTLKELSERENVQKVYIPKKHYDAIDPEIIRQKEAEFNCVIIPVDEHEMKRVKDYAVPYTMPPKLPDIKMLQPAVYDLPHVKGGRYHEPPRDLKKKKKAKRRQQKKSRRKR